MKMALKRFLPLLLAVLLMIAAAQAETTETVAAVTEARAQNITGQCTIRVSEGDRGKLLDRNVRSAWEYNDVGAWVGFKVPENVTVGGMLIEWMFDPVGLSIEEYDAAQALIRTRDENATFPGIVSNYTLLPETKYVIVRMTAKGNQLCDLYIYSAGAISDSVQIWQPPVEKADLMVVSTHQDDELIFLGGTIPYYAVAKQRPTIVVYMANCTRYRRMEALNGLWAMGVRNYPEFINLQDKRIDSFDESLALWGGAENVVGLLVERIRRFKPEVIVTQDLDGEYGHNQHKITARAMKYAVNAAADESYYPESAAKYGTWQVKKLYHHLYEENKLQMDWETKLEALGGHSPLEMAQIGYEEHASQHQWYSVDSGGKYDNSLFGLMLTTVGADVEKNDFFENIPDTSAYYTTSVKEEELIEEAPLLPSEEQEPAPIAATDVAEDEASPGEVSVEGDADSGDAAQWEPQLPEVGQEAALTGDDAPVLAPAQPDATPEPVRTTERRGGWVAPALGLVALGGLAGGAAYGLRRASNRRRHHRRRR